MEGCVEDIRKIIVMMGSNDVHPSQFRLIYDRMVADKTNITADKLSKILATEYMLLVLPTFVRRHASAVIATAIQREFSSEFSELARKIRAIHPGSAPISSPAARNTSPIAARYKSIGESIAARKEQIEQADRQADTKTSSPIRAASPKTPFPSSEDLAKRPPTKKTLEEIIAARRQEMAIRDAELAKSKAAQAPQAAQAAQAAQAGRFSPIRAPAASSSPSPLSAQNIISRFSSQKQAQSQAQTESRPKAGGTVGAGWPKVSARQVASSSTSRSDSDTDYEALAEERRQRMRESLMKGAPVPLNSTAARDAGANSPARSVSPTLSPRAPLSPTSAPHKTYPFAPRGASPISKGNK
jgi:hypothetical protein